MLPIKSGRLNKPVKAVIYGLEGTGKSTLAAQTPNPLFLDTEGGTTYLDEPHRPVYRLGGPAEHHRGGGEGHLLLLNVGHRYR